MRYLLASILFLAIPGGLAAQDAGAASVADPMPVQLEQSVTSDLAPPAPITAEGLTAERTVESTEAPAESPVVQDPGSRQWWWIVGAVVVGGLILALVL